MRIKRLLLILALPLLISGGGASAREIRQGDECAIPADEVIVGNLFALCRTLTLEGRVEGNLFAAASVMVVNGAVTGDAYLMAGQLDLAGSIGQNLHFVGPVLRIQPGAQFASATGDLVSLSLSATLGEDVTIPGGVVNLGYELNLDGVVGGELNFWGGALNIGGAVGGNVNATVGDPDATAFTRWLNLLFPLFWSAEVKDPGLILAEGGRVGGGLYYAGPDAGRLEGQVAGETVYTPVSVQPDLTQIIPEEQRGGRELGVYLSQAVQELLTLAVVGLIGLAAAPRALQLPLRQMRARPLASLGAGVVTFVLSFFVFVAVVLLGVALIVFLARMQLNGLTLIGGITLGVGALGSAGVLFLVLGFVTRVMVALFAGRWLVQVAVGDDGSPRITTLGLIVGLVLLAALAALPVVGWVINLAAMCFGLGAIIVHLYLQTRPAVYERAPVFVHRADIAPPPPPIMDDTHYPPGMENLPEDFRWWDD